MSLELLLGPQLRAFSLAGYEVIGVSAPGPYVARLGADGIQHISLRGASRSWSLTSDLKAFRSLYRLFRELKPDIVHTHNPKPGVYGRIAARLAGVPRVVNTVHGLYATPDDSLAKRSAVYAIERFAAIFSDVELVQNQEDLALLRRLRVPANKLVLLGNGIDLGRFSPGTVDAETRESARLELGARSADDVVIGFVGRMVREKGIVELLEAAEVVTAKCPNARFALIGFHDPSRQDDVPPALLKEAVERGVAILGARSDVVELYSGMDVFVLPSHREGFPRSVMEASAMGVPVVATDIRGCREAVVDDVTGILVPAHNVSALASALERLILDTDARVRLAGEAVSKANADFSVQTQIDVTVAAYRRLS